MAVPYFIIREANKEARIINEHVISFYDRYASLQYLDIDTDYDVRQVIWTCMEEYVKEHYYLPTRIVVSRDVWYKIMTQLTTSIHTVSGNNHITKIFGMELIVDNFAEDNKVEVYSENEKIFYSKD